MWKIGFAIWYVNRQLNCQSSYFTYQVPWFNKLYGKSPFNMHWVSYVIIFMLIGEEVLIHAMIRWEFRLEIILSLESLVIYQMIISSKKYKRENHCTYINMNLTSGCVFWMYESGFNSMSSGCLKLFISLLNIANCFILHSQHAIWLKTQLTNSSYL